MIIQYTWQLGTIGPFDVLFTDIKDHLPINAFLSYIENRFVRTGTETVLKSAPNS
jgi:hypothetical protein